MSTTVKELIKAANLKPGFVVSDPETGGEYRIGNRGRPPVWLADRLAEMVDHSLLATTKPKKAAPVASKTISSKSITVQGPAEIFTPDGSWVATLGDSDSTMDCPSTYTIKSL
jgi:hypothetical protein